MLWVVAAIAVLALWLWRGCSARETARVSSAESTPTKEAPSPATTSTPAQTASTITPGTPPVSPAPNPIPPAEQHQLRALMFTMDGSGIRLEQAQVLNGRAKAPPLSGALYRLEFEVYDREGRQIYAGSVDHPRRKVYEYEDPKNPGTLRRQPHEVESESFQLRLPAELSPARIQFFETIPTRNRVPLQTITLP